MIAVFEGLLRIGFIEVTREGHFDRTTYQGKTTRFVARDELLERLQELDGHPAISIKPDLDAVQAFTSSILCMSWKSTGAEIESGSASKDPRRSQSPAA
jgi:hypothetical protein